MCLPNNQTFTIKTVSFRVEEVSTTDLGKTPLAFEKRRLSFDSQHSFDSTNSAEESFTSSSSCSRPRRYRRQRQKSSKDIHKTFFEASLKEQGE